MVYSKTLSQKHRTRCSVALPDLGLFYDAVQGNPVEFLEFLGRCERKFKLYGPPKMFLIGHRVRVRDLYREEEEEAMMRLSSQKILPMTSEVNFEPSSFWRASVLKFFLSLHSHNQKSHTRSKITLVFGWTVNVIVHSNPWKINFNHAVPKS